MKQKKSTTSDSMRISWCTCCATKPYCGALQGRKLPNLCAGLKSQSKLTKSGQSSKTAEIICLQKKVGKLFRDVDNGAKGVSSRTQAYLQDRSRSEISGDQLTTAPSPAELSTECPSLESGHALLLPQRSGS